MMTDQLAVLLAACFLVLGFIFLLYALKLVEHAKLVTQISRQSLEIMGDATLNDDEKEKAMQENAVKLFKLFVILTLGGAVSLLAPAAIIWGIGNFGWISFDAVIHLTLDWRFLIGTTVIGISIYLVKQKLGRLNKKDQAENKFENRYSSVDRLLHQIAFATGPVQVTLSHLEDSIFKKKLQASPGKPVFITGLPRSGTTLLLEIFQQLPEFSTHSYRHMPFIMMPLFWDRFASNFRTQDIPRERAHGDGMTVGLDSPEAFEEKIWMQFWPNHYKKNMIIPWRESSTSEFEQYFDQHRKKIALLGVQADSKPVRLNRYISKNNLNIARIEFLINTIPDCKIVLPFRDPYQHSASLLRQHLNFLRIHANDEFSRSYMAGIGHFDFGLNLKPVNFGHWLEKTPYKDATKLSFWLSYWEATYSYLLQHDSSRIKFIDFDALCIEPVQTMEQLAEFIGIDNKMAFIKQAARIHPQTTHEVNLDDIDIELINRIECLKKNLKLIQSQV